MKLIKKYKIVLILLLITVISNIWLLIDGIPLTHDIEFHYSRIIGLNQTLKNLDFIAFIHDTYYGYGHAVGIFYGNILIYIPALLNFFISGIQAYKVFYLMISFTTLFSMYHTLLKVTKNKKISVIGSIVYYFSAYRMIDIFLRGALGEILSFIFIPFIILGIYEIIDQDPKKWYIFSISFVLLFQNHLITTLLMFILIGIIILINVKRIFTEKERMKYLIISIIVGLLLSSINFFPILEQKFLANINIFTRDPIVVSSNYAVSFSNMFIPSYVNPFESIYLGLSILFLILLIPLRLIIKNINIEDKKICNLGDILLCFSFIFLVLSTNIIDWDHIKIMNVIQFPFRFLIVPSSFLIIAFCIYFKLLENYKLMNLKVVYITLIVLSLFNLVYFEFGFGIVKYHFKNMNNNNVGTYEYFIQDTDFNSLNYDNPEIITNNTELVYSYQKKGKKVNIKYSNNNQKNTYIEVPLFNYLGYKVEGATIENGNNNLIRLLLHEKSGNIKLYYQGTTIQHVSVITSAVSWIGLMIYIIFERRKKYGFSKKIRSRNYTSYEG